MKHFFVEMFLHNPPQRAAHVVAQNECDAGPQSDQHAIEQIG